eukprot:CAMPEP_0206212300 /NCGR_PEP_ID=MMETSP0047_2-20121206/484_1 /ASSEMBLY_ACC=CAM_ASM_000192 /TAXON_ID=195065 /ORGANISM="Chroomonas mesostigmatica_cf, Strain CCMP1168" /LENGTH=125 /DNA_ID=CAMNT_0053634311 /DNA_START=114 /DNA_END=488 /DNA_ORIENTATION=+
MTRAEIGRFSWIRQLPLFPLIQRAIVRPLMLVFRPLRHFIHRYLPTADKLRMTGDVDEEMLQIFISELTKKGAFDFGDMGLVEEEAEAPAVDEEKDINPPEAQEEEEAPEMDDDMGSDTLEQAHD